MAGSAEIDRADEIVLHELVTCLGVTVGPELVRVAPQRGDAATEISFAGLRIVGNERIDHDTLQDRIGVVRVGHLVAEIALDAIGVAGSQA